MNNKKILVAPLDWGLGHATRCIPVISVLIKKGVQVEIGGNGASLQLLKREFPQLKFHLLPGMEIEYAKGGNFLLKLLRQLPDFLSAVKTENSYLFTLIQSEKFDAVISDNRYGLYSDMIPAVIITHQLRLKPPSHLQFIENYLQRKIQRYIENFDLCWVPDYSGENNLSGELSHNHSLKIPVEFTGPLSRFNNLHQSDVITFNFDLLALISGPEPQRTVFENLIESQARQKKIATLIIRGKPDEEESIMDDGLVKKINHAGSAFITEAVNKSKAIVARAGYSTIMDLVAMKKGALLVPTPGQTEQEYLAKYLKGKFNFKFSSQDKLDINDAFFTSANDYINKENNRLDNSIDNLLSKLK